MQHLRGSLTPNKCLVNVISLLLLFLQYIGNKLFCNKANSQHQKQAPSSSFVSAELCDFSKVTFPLWASALFPYLQKERIQGDDHLQVSQSAALWSSWLAVIRHNEGHPFYLAFPDRGKGTPHSEICFHGTWPWWMIATTRLSWLLVKETTLTFQLNHSLCVASKRWNRPARVHTASCRPNQD